MNETRETFLDLNCADKKYRYVNAKNIKFQKRSLLVYVDCIVYESNQHDKSITIRIIATSPRERRKIIFKLTADLKWYDIWKLIPESISLEKDWEVCQEN